MGHKQGLQRSKSLGTVGPVAHRHAGTTGIARHLQVVRGVADHQGALRRNTKLGHQLVEHQWMRFALCLVSRTRGIKQLPQFNRPQGSIQTTATFASGHGQQVLARLEFMQHGQGALKKADALLFGHVVVLVPGAELGMALGRNIWRSVCQGRAQTHTNHVGCILVTGHPAAHIRHRLLDAAHNDGSRIKQGAVPVEGNQVKASVRGGLIRHD